MHIPAPASLRATPAFTARLLIVALVASLVAMYGPFDRLAQADAAGADIDVEKLSGEDIFRATFLGTGPAAPLMPEMERFRADLERHEAYDPDEAKKAEQQLMAILEQSDPTFYDDLRAGFTSGDPVTVSKTQSEAADQVLTALYESEGLDPSTIPEDLAAGVVIVAVVAVVVVAVAVAVAVVVVVVVFSAASSLQYDEAYERVDMDEYDQLIDSYSGSLDRDSYIADVTSAFATSSGR